MADTCQEARGTRSMGDMREISLGHGKVMLVDDEDYDFMTQFEWRAKKDSEGRYYAHATLVAHKLLVKYSIVDHVNGNGLDNRKENLRVATPQQNSWNRGIRSDSRTGYKGVRYIPDRDAYSVRIQVNGQRKYLGYFKDPVEAAKAYDVAAREHFGEFARPNFPNKEVMLGG
jgi:hypothetical protein